MMKNTMEQRLAVLSDAAKYDASCASSGSKRGAGEKNGLGTAERMGICHSWAPDGRCISLLKILMTNHCIHDCVFCVNRRSSDVQRARFSAEEIAWLTMEFYRRNYIEGLFLSSGIIRSPDYTMEHMVKAVRDLRLVHNFRGYIHLKAIPDASPELVHEAGLFADRLSINVELPTDDAVRRLAPQKQPLTIRGTMGDLKNHIEEAKERTLQTRRRKRFAPAGQSTQMIIGADEANDATILTTSVGLYKNYELKRVYYSAFSPTPHPSAELPVSDPPLLREHRLYQADWLYRFYGFDIEEITASRTDGMLALDMDPKLSWALANRGVFPIDVNSADREMLLRVPGFGVTTVNRLLKARRVKRLRYEDIARLRIPLRKARPFFVADGWSPRNLLDTERTEALFRPPPLQLSLF